MLASTYAERLENATKYVQNIIKERPDVGVVLGSGLGSYGDELANPIKIPYKEIPGMLDTTVPGHFGCLIYGMIGERKVLCLSGRSHQYEGLHPHEIQFAIRLLGMIGCRLVILTNAAGTRDPQLNVGDLAPMLDHLNFTHRGYTEEPLEIKDFYHMIQNDMYDAEAQRVAKEVAAENKLSSRGCNYTYNMGPTYESHAEVEGQWKLGCTNFGMSTVAEVIAAKEIGVPILAMSFVTNKAAGVGGEVLTHEDVAKAAKAGEAGMKNLVSTTIKRVTLKEFPIPTMKGDKRNITRAEPAAFASDEVIAAAAAEFGETKIDAAVVCAGTHSLPVDVKLTVSLCDLPEFPVLQHTRAVMKIGTLAGKRVAVVDGVFDYCGFDHYATYYLVKLFEKLGAKKYIQTFAAGAFQELGVQTVKDLLQLWERPIVVPQACPHTEMTGKAILASYHGPEFWTPTEGKGMTVIGATHATLGLTVGLEIANSLKMKVAGVVDGAFDAKLPAGTTIEQIIKATTEASPKVAKAVEDELASVECGGELKASFKAGDKKGLKWDDVPAHPVNKQECPELVKKIADKLPAVAAALVVECPMCIDNLKLDFHGEVEVEGNKLRLAKLGDKEIFVAKATRELLRACAEKKIHVVGLGVIVSTNDKLKEGEVVAVKDHMNIVGISPLMGKNNFGVRFPDLSGIYKEIDGLKGVITFNLPSLNIATPAYLKAAEIMGCDAVSQYGAVNSMVVRHSQGTYSHIAVVVKCPKCSWTVDPAVIAKAI